MNKLIDQLDTRFWQHVLEVIIFERINYTNFIIIH